MALSPAPDDPNYEAEKARKERDPASFGDFRLADLKAQKELADAAKAAEQPAAEPPAAEQPAQPAQQPARKR